MTTYEIVWRIELDADSSREAAEKALAIQRDVFSSAVCFEVTPTGTNQTDRIDLEENDD